MVAAALPLGSMRVTAEAAGEATAPGAGMKKADPRSGAALAAALTASAGATMTSFPGVTMVSARTAARPGQP